MAPSTNVGISNLKQLIGFLNMAVSQVITIDQDGNGKVSIGEALSAITALGLKTPALVAAIPHIKEEWKDLSREEMDELVKWFAAEFDLPMQKDRIERIIELSIETLVYNFKKFQEFKSLLAAE